MPPKAMIVDSVIAVVVIAVAFALVLSNSPDGLSAATHLLCNLHKVDTRVFAHGLARMKAMVQGGWR